MSGNLKNVESSALCSTHWPPKNWPGALDHLAIGLVDNRYITWKNRWKIVIYFGVGLYKSPTMLGIAVMFWFFSSKFSKIYFTLISESEWTVGVLISMKENYGLDFFSFEAT